MWRGRSSAAGHSAEAYYQEALEAWRSQPVLYRLRLFFVAVLAGSVAIEVFWLRQTGSWLLGLAAGLGVCAYMALYDWAPHHIEQWHRGAEGEKKTGRVLEHLEPAEWAVFHDLSDDEYGNLDHVVVGPGGVFLLDTKWPQGTASVRRGVMEVRRSTNRRGTYRDRKLVRRLHEAAKRLSGQLREGSGRRIWVQPVVVIWSEFPQGQTKDNGVVFIHGTLLYEWLASCPTGLSRERIQGLQRAVGQRSAA
jgi:hypothetical protein